MLLDNPAIKFFSILLAGILSEFICFFVLSTKSPSFPSTKGKVVFFSCSPRGTCATAWGLQLLLFLSPHRDKSFQKRFPCLNFEWTNSLCSSSGCLMPCLLAAEQNKLHASVYSLLWYAGSNHRPQNPVGTCGMCRCSREVPGFWCPCERSTNHQQYGSASLLKKLLQIYKWDGFVYSNTTLCVEVKNH